MNSADDQAVVKAYTNKKGALSYELLHKALIKATRSNPDVGDLIARTATDQEISDHGVKANLELFDAVSPRSVLAELQGAIQRMLAEARR